MKNVRNPLSSRVPDMSSTSAPRFRKSNDSVDLRPIKTTMTTRPFHSSHDPHNKENVEGVVRANVPVNQ